MKRIKLAEQAEALVLIAHPDDETIWMGGTILLNPHIAWTIFSLCRASDADRAPKFRKVCRYYGARAIITDLDDEGKLSVPDTIPLIKKYIKSNAAQNYQYIFSHGENGEYGHPRHIGVNLALRELLKEKFFRPETVFYFHYQKEKGENNRIEPKSKADWLEALNKNIFNKKREIVANMYGYPKDGIDVGYCTNPEAFKALNN